MQTLCTFVFIVKNVLFFFPSLFLSFVTVKPERPIITKLESGSSFIHVTWKPPKNPCGIPVTGYFVQAIDVNNPNNVLNCSDIITSIFRCTIYGVQPNTTYAVRVLAVGSAGYGFLTQEKLTTKYEGKLFTSMNRRLHPGLVTLSWW